MSNSDLPPTVLKNVILLEGKYCAKQSLKKEMIFLSGTIVQKETLSHTN